MTMEIGLRVDLERDWIFLSPFISKAVYLTASTILMNCIRNVAGYLKPEFDNVAPESVSICCVN